MEKVEFKLVFLDRKTGKALLPENVPAVGTCFTLDLAAFTQSAAVLDGLLGGPADMQARTCARAMSEMFGADVYYRIVPPASANNGLDWLKQRGSIPKPAGESEVAARIKKQTDIIVDVLESVDQRCSAADGPVTPTRDEITGDELRRLYKAANSIRKELSK